MKRILLVLLLAINVLVYSQIPKEAFELTNSLPDLWEKENPEEAIKSSEKLNEIFQPFFIDRLHHSLAQTILRNKGKGNETVFLNELYKKDKISIKKIIEPIYLWNKSFKINRSDKADSLLKTYYAKLSDSTNYNSKIELYGLLIVKEFEDKEIGSSKLKDKILSKIVLNLSLNPLINNPAKGNRRIKEERAYYRFLLAYNYNLLFEKNKTEESIKNASKYSPDQTDLQNKSGYFYDAYLLVNDLKNINYKKKYINFLSKNGKQEIALDMLLEETYIQATNENLKNLKGFYNQIVKNKTFKTIWSNYLNSKMLEVPKIKVEFKEEILDLSKKRDSWVYIDIWGTWCAPCIKELPEFDKVAKEYNKKLDSKIKFYSFSYNSKKLEEFMNKNNYTFPVSEINKQITQLFKVSAYPTKILISPDNKYLKIPFGVNWKEFIKNYTLID
ncbi:Thiol-disulfide isomerase or thioredoxin [Polaribacter sp. KT25b]|uniref:TlpA family protein disulfide reductase n=1 Tax=Polaribacter sp. KT25b TaxID=1855336 RepID=UPI00087BD727|nr:TlpA disulfide reductase family protein [Polaribacter sp. KT25b]SDR95118.1 Thiol-disulfide isomerase or thioredoxin [Polaribacter sp. KT25b]